jgi:hypothetical protein
MLLSVLTYFLYLLTTWVERQRDVFPGPELPEILVNAQNSGFLGSGTDYNLYRI